VLPKADLRATCLVRADLRGADLSGASLMLADLEECDLTDAVLVGADLRGARLNGAKLAGARLDGVDLGPVALRGPLETARRSLDQGGHTGLMKDVDARGAVFVNANLQHCALSGSDLTGANLEGADLNGAVMEDVAYDADSAVAVAHVSRSVAAGAVSFNIMNAVDQHELFLRSRGLKGAQLNVKGQTIDKAELRMRDLRQARFIDCRLIGVSFAECDLSQADFAGSQLDGISFADAIVAGTSFRRTAIRQSAFSRAKIEGLSFGDSKTSLQTTFEGARLEACEFKGANFAQVLFRNTAATPSTVLQLQNAGVPPMVLRRLTVVQGD